MKLLFRTIAVSLIFVLVPALGAQIDGHNLPDKVNRFSSDYSLVGCGLREFMFIDIYLLGMYLPAGTGVLSNIENADTGKIFVLDVLYKGDLPEDLPNLWREPLAEEISSELLQILQEQYDQVNTGDRVEMAYQPGQGEELRINGEVVIQEHGRELMPALVELWLGNDPVSGNLKRLLLNGDCS